jgi:hypothetical protein
VTSSNRTDKFGVPLSRVNWQVSEQERKTIEMTARLFSSEVRRLGFVMSGRRPLIKGFFAALRLIVGAVMSSAC